MNSSIIRISSAMCGVVFLISSCATPPDKIEAAYVSPIQYEDYTCDQIKAEAGRVSDRAAHSLGIQQKKAKNDAVKTGVAIVLFWPAVFFIDGKGANESEVARLKGEMETLEKVSIQKDCGIEFQRVEPIEPPKKTPKHLT